VQSDSDDVRGRVLEVDNSGAKVAGRGRSLPRIDRGAWSKSAARIRTHDRQSVRLAAPACRHVERTRRTSSGPARPRPAVSRLASACHTAPVPPRRGNLKRLFGPHDTSSRCSRTFSRTRARSATATRSPIHRQSMRSGLRAHTFWLYGRMNRSAIPVQRSAESTRRSLWLAAADTAGGVLESRGGRHPDPRRGGDADSAGTDMGQIDRASRPTIRGRGTAIRRTPSRSSINWSNIS
jgi:hypothetical protein